MKCVDSQKNLHNSINQYFPNGQCIMLQNHARVKDPREVQDRPEDFNRSECEK